MMGSTRALNPCSTTFGPDDQVSENHLLRLVDKHIDFG
jgi:hypothetical protein